MFKHANRLANEEVNNNDNNNNNNNKLSDLSMMYHQILTANIGGASVSVFIAHLS